MQVIHVCQFVAIERLLAVYRDHVVQNLGRTRIVLCLRKRLRLGESLIHLIAESWGSACLAGVFLWLVLGDCLRNQDARSRLIQNKGGTQRQCSKG